MKTTDDQPAFNALVPLLDEALLSLREQDRTALLLRYCESQSLRDVGSALGVSDDTAQKRVTIALEKLSQFFQRRGFKTATVAATTAALQHTASSASAATVSLVFNAALQAAPPALVGITALLARFASLTKIQTAVLCLAVAAVPVAWQWNSHNDVRDQLSRVQNESTARETELVGLLAEIEKLRATTTKHETELADANTKAAMRASQAQELGDWRKRLRERLLAADYSWPEDLSLVRIPKAAVAEMDMSRPILRPGNVAVEARELLGLTPDERRKTEDVLQNHFMVIDKLADEKFYQTNSATRAYIPKHAIVSNVWVVPKLGEAASEQVQVLKSGLENILRGERWMLAQRGMNDSGMGTLDTALGLSVADTKQEVAGWVINTGDGPSVSFHIAGSIHDRGMFWSTSLPAIPLRTVITTTFEDGTADSVDLYVWNMHAANIPQPVKDGMVAWMRKLAAQANDGGVK